MATQDASCKSCFEYCPACHRCKDKGYRTICHGCTGRIDTLGIYDPYDRDDFCQCSLGVLRWRTKQGRLIITRYKGNPYGGQVKYENRSQDEQDWEQFLQQSRERLDDETWDPVQFLDGSSTTDWAHEWRQGF